MKELKIYTTPFCPQCKLLKQYFASKGISYTEINIFNNEELIKYIKEKANARSTPVIEYGDKFIVGFKKPQIDILIGEMNNGN